MPTSIWLQLSGEADRALRAVIAGLAAAHRTVPFQPHLTVCSLPHNEAAIVDAVADYVRRCGLLPLHARRAAISCSTAAPFRAVTIDVEDTSKLRAFREEVRRIAGAPELEPPHISLLYTIGEDRKPVAWATDAARLRAIANDATAVVGDFTLDAPVVTEARGEWADIRSWKLVRRL